MLKNVSYTVEIYSVLEYKKKLKVDHKGNNSGQSKIHHSSWDFFIDPIVIKMNIFEVFLILCSKWRMNNIGDQYFIIKSYK